MLFVPSFAFAHTTVDVEHYEIEVGWGTEDLVESESLLKKRRLVLSWHSTEKEHT